MTCLVMNLGGVLVVCLYGSLITRLTSRIPDMIDEQTYDEQQ